MAFRLEPVKNWRSYLPILDVLRRYRSGDFSHDAVAGVILGVITVPQAVAYAFLAGLPAEAGLYACLVPMILYAILGSSRELVVGPVAVAALMVAATVKEFAPAYSYEYLSITTVISLQAGLLLWVLRLSRMGGIVNLMSHPVVSGFVNAAALIIILSQLLPLIGQEAPVGAGTIGNLQAFIEGLTHINPAALAIGVGSLLVLILVQRFAHRAISPFFRAQPDGALNRTGPMFVVLLSVVAVVMFDLDNAFGVATVGAIPAGLPALTVPPFDPDLWIDLAPSSAIIALVAYVESFTVATMLATRRRQRVNSHQDLIALGAANIGAAFTGAYPVAGSFSRSSVNYSAGARTPISALVCAVVIIFTLLALTPLFERLPQAALAAIIAASVYSLMDFRSLRKDWDFYHHDVITHFVTMGFVLATDVETGLLVGVAISIALFIRRSSRPTVTLIGRIPNSEIFRSSKRHKVETFVHVAAVRIDENIYFANANQIENRLLKVLQQKPRTRHLLLNLSAVNLIDVSGLEMLRRVNENMRRMDIKLHLAEVKGKVLLALEKTELPLALSGSIFFSTDQAMRDLSDRA
ncbi:MAG: sulfate permease [Pseudomonadota bacterium]